MGTSTDELNLLERVFFRIGSADTDEQLQNAVSKFLPPVLLKLSSQHDGVRKKVMELLVHINKRIKSRPSVQLPVDALLLQYQDPSASSFVINFTIIYLRMGFPRLPISKQAELVPCVLNALEGKPQSHQDSLLLILMPVLKHVAVPQDSEKRNLLFGLNEKPHISKMLLDFMLDVLLLPYGSTTSQTDQSNSASSSSSTIAVPPGMSEYGFKRVTADSSLKLDELEEAKVGIVKFLSSDVLPDADILCHLIVAAADTRFRVANAADMELKKIIGLLDWGSASVTAPIYSIFLGTQQVTSRKTSPAIRPELRRLPVGTRIRLKILPHLCRAHGAALIFPSCIQVFFDSLYGENTNSRLQNLALQFSLVIILGSSIQRLSTVGAVLLSGLLKLISEERGSLAALAYSAVGKLAHRLPHLANKDLSLLQAFFQILVKEEPDTRMSVREALLSMVDAFKLGLEESSPGHQQLKLMMEALLESQIDSQEPMARFVAVIYSAAVFPPTHAASRYLLLLACGDGKEEIAVEAFRALYGTSQKLGKDDKINFAKSSGDKNKNSLQLPAFQDMLHYISTKSATRMQNPSTRYNIGCNSLPFSVTTYTEMMVYLHLCLLQSADIHCVSRDALLQSPPPTAHTPILGRYITKLARNCTKLIDRHIDLLQKLIPHSTTPLPLACLTEIVGSSTSIVSDRLPQHLTMVKGFLTSTKEKMREIAAILFSFLVIQSGTEDKIEEAIREMIRSISNKNLEAQHGSALALGCILERLVTYLKNNNRLNELNNWPSYKEAVQQLVNLLSSPHVLLLGAACSGIGSLGCKTALPLPNGSNSDPSGKLDLVKKLQDIMMNPKLNIKVRERAAMTAGYLCVGEQFPHSREVIEGFLVLARETKDIEIHLSIGEALVCCVQGTSSPIARDSWTTLEEEYEAPAVNESTEADLRWLLEELCKMANHHHPNFRQASCILLLSILKRCPKRPLVEQNLEEFQKIFMDMLGDNNDIIQDVASKGLGLVYECCDEKLRTVLVKKLEEQLITGRRTVGIVTEDTKLFEDQALGKSPTGGNLTTYKELCSLASDLNKPDLIYKFMHLANHNSIWNSKKGAAFGFSTIAAVAGEQLTQYLPKIVPRLYRYQFDPNQKIQASMTSIWRELVPESQKTIELYQKEILEDLLKHLTSNQWRVRISCCFALSDFFRSGGISLYDCKEKVPELWIQLFRVMDDVHEGTRQAAANTASVLSKLTIKCCDINQGKIGEEMVTIVLPVFLKYGICNAFVDVRTLSLQCISHLVGAAGLLLKPHLSTLIPALLEATGESEMKSLSQLSVQFSADHREQDIVDSVRASVAKSHFTTETVTKCLQYIDTASLVELIPKVLDLMKNSVSLGTKIACSHFIVLLSHHMKVELQPYTGKLLAVLVNGITDRNAAIRKNYAVTIGHLVATGKDSSIEKLVTKIRTWYLEREDETIRSACAYTIQSIGQHNQEILKAHSKMVLPLVFFAIHGQKTEGSSVTIWEEIWQDETPGPESGIRQNLDNICSLLKEALESPSWTMKSQAAAAIGTVAQKVGASLNEQQCIMLVNILLQGLSGRTWNGKEKLLGALATICVNCRDKLRTSDCDSIVEAILKESRKEQIVYKQHALKSLGDVLESLEIDRFADVYGIVQQILTKENTEDSDSEEIQNQEDRNEKEENMIKLKKVVYETLGKAWPNSKETQVCFQEKVVADCVACLMNSTRTVQVAIIVALSYYVKKLNILSEPIESDEKDTLKRILEQIYEAIKYALGVAKHSTLRVEAMNVIYLIAKKLKESKKEVFLGELNNIFSSFLKDTSKDSTPEIMSKVAEIKNILQS